MSDVDAILGDLPQYTDTLAAIHVVLQSRRENVGVPNLILRHQLYAIIQDKTEVATTNFGSSLVSHFFHSRLMMRFHNCALKELYVPFRFHFNPRIYSSYSRRIIGVTLIQHFQTEKPKRRMCCYLF